MVDERGQVCYLELKIFFSEVECQMNGIKGVHHVTAITSSAEKNYEFFTYILGMRLVKKTVNQDDIKTYHLFFADDEGNPGTDMTFFDFPGIPKGSHGTNEISKTSFRVPSDEALLYWVKRFDHYDISHKGIQERFGKKVLPFTDFDDQTYELVSDEGVAGVPSGIPWQKGRCRTNMASQGSGHCTFGWMISRSSKKRWRVLFRSRKSLRKVRFIYLKSVREVMERK